MTKKKEAGPEIFIFAIENRKVKGKMTGVSPNLAEKTSFKIVEKFSCNWKESDYNRANMDRGAVHVPGPRPESNLSAFPALEGGKQL